jgi:hypothetical protein
MKADAVASPWRASNLPHTLPTIRRPPHPKDAMRASLRVRAEHNRAASASPQPSVASVSGRPLIDRRTLLTGAAASVLTFVGCPCSICKPGEAKAAGWSYGAWAWRDFCMGIERAAQCPTHKRRSWPLSRTSARQERVLRAHAGTHLTCANHRTCVHAGTQLTPIASAAHRTCCIRLQERSLGRPTGRACARLASGSRPLTSPSTRRRPRWMLKWASSTSRTAASRRWTS